VSKYKFLVFWDFAHGYDSVSKNMEINTRTLVKIYALNKDDEWVSRDQMDIHSDEEHDRGEAQPISSDNGFETMFKRLSMTFSPEKMSRVEDWLENIESEMHHKREDV